MTEPEPRVEPPGQCDAPNAPIYSDGKGLMDCRCIVCARCGHHTGNNTQGHWWGLCKVTKTIRAFHFCCPGDCELGPLDPNLTCPAPCGEPVKQGRILCPDHQEQSDTNTIAGLQVRTRPPGMWGADD